MAYLTTNKSRLLLDAFELETATATPAPAFPTGPDANGRVVFAGDFMGCRIGSIRWFGTFSGFTAADLTVQHSDDGENWTTLKAFTQVTSSPFNASISLLVSDPVPKRFLRALLDMTGTPGSSVHSIEVSFAQEGARGSLAPPGYIDRAS